MKKTQMNWTRGPFSYGVDFSQAPQLKKDDLHSQINVQINEYLNTKRLCRPGHIPLSGFVDSCSSSSLSNKRIPIASIEPGYTPPKFSMNPSWLVAAGEDSEECISQRNRESKVQEAIFRHKSSIPLNPIVSMEVQHEHYDDSLTPIIPLIPIEELDISHSSPQILEKPELPITTSTSSLSSIIMQQQIPSAFPSTSVNKPAADENMNRQYGGIDATALTVLLKNGELSPTIDTDLLLKILSDPKMIGALLNNSPASAAETPPQRKEEYYKKLIRQHGAENNILTEKIITHHLDSENIPKNEQKLNFDKSKKRCRFFNGKSGCRNGASCLFLHEVKQPVPGGYRIPAVVEENCAKRLRVG